MKKYTFLIFLFCTQRSFAELDLSFHLNAAPMLGPYIPSPLMLAAPKTRTSNSAQTTQLHQQGSPELIKIPKITLSPPRAQTFPNLAVTSKLPVVLPLNLQVFQPLSLADLKIKELIDISADEYKMIEALLLFEKQKKPERAFVLFADLIFDSKFKSQASYHYALLALKFELREEFKNMLISLIKSDTIPLLKKKAAESLVQFAEVLDVHDVRSLEEQIELLKLASLDSDAYKLRRAQSFEQMGELSLAQRILEQIANTSKQAIAARLLSSNLKYRQADLDGALRTLETSPALLKSAQAHPLRNITLLTLARLYFQKSQYKQAYATYLKIDKASSVWLTASIEQALTQNLAGDYIGAAGNMFSLHTEYFKKAYAPESYVARAIGYLNLCQFGDAVSVIAELDKRYSKLNETLKEFKNHHTSSNDYYLLIRDIFSNPEQTEVQGLPRSFVLDLARSPAFLSFQKNINRLEEENTKFNKLVSQLNSASLKKAYAKFQSQYSNKKTSLKEKAALALFTHFKKQVLELAEVIEQKDILAYEIYAGAGEHMRYQMAGGESAPRNPTAALTPEEKQSYKWKFRGEFWEDEVGHYRSSLANICPESDKKITQNKSGGL